MKKASVLTAEIMHEEAQSGFRKITFGVTDGASTPLEAIRSMPPDEKDLMTVEQIIYIEPQLRELAKLAASIKDDGGKYFCANKAFFGTHTQPSIKTLMSGLVGWQSKHPVLRTMAAYSTMYHHLYGMLPDCRNCSC